MSFVAIVYAKEGKTLLGGVREHHSSRWGDREDAEAFRDSTVDINKENVESAEIVTRNKYPEIFRHCKGAAAQAINGACFGCLKILTIEDAKFFESQARLQRAKEASRGKEKA